jgi:adenylate cyclase
VKSFLSPNTYGPETTFKAAEAAGMKLAIRGRFIAILILGSVILLTRDAGRASDFLMLFGAFALIGIAHYVAIGSSWDRS